MGKFLKIIRLLLLIILAIALGNFPIMIDSIPNYIDLLNSLQQLIIFMFGIFLAILGSINIFRNYNFISKLYQVGVDLQLTKFLLSLSFQSGLLACWLTVGFLFDKCHSTIIGRIYISILALLMFKMLFDTSYLLWIFNRIFKNYIKVEERERNFK